MSSDRFFFSWIFAGRVGDEILLRCDCFCMFYTRKRVSGRIRNRSSIKGSHTFVARVECLDQISIQKVELNQNYTH